jgi:hypothetical protein
VYSAPPCREIASGRHHGEERRRVGRWNA